MAPEIETTLVNAVLTNGARYYVDHAHPEISTPEVPPRSRPCASTGPPRRSSAAAWSTPRPSSRRPAGPAEVIVYKNNSDGKGNSYGCHENYLLARETPFGRIVAQVTPHFVTRQIFTGAGKVGCELPGVPTDHVPYQLSQRADFFEEEVGLETTLKRPIVNTRDEPHCDAQKYRRLHVIVGDANMSEVATYLKVGTTAIVLAMIEDDALGDDWLLGNPVSAIRQVSHDPTLTRTIMLRDGRRATALEIQWGLLERARKYEQLHGLACVGEEVGRDVLRRWEQVLAGLEHDPPSVAAGSTGSPSSASSTATPSATASRPARRPAQGDRPAVPRPAPGPGPRRRGPVWRRSSTTADVDDGDHRAADDHPGLLPRPVPASTPTRSWRPTGTRSCSTSAGSRCGGSR